MKKFPGSTIVEALMTLCVIGIAAPAFLSALGGVLTAELRIQERAGMISASEWWFGKLTHPVTMEDINAAPKTDCDGKARFEWETEKLSEGAVRVILRVYGRLPGSEFTVSRIF